MSWSTSELRVRLAPLNRFKPSSKIFYWPFQGGTSFVDLLCFCSVLCLLCFVRVCLYVLRGHLLGKGWPLGSHLWCLLWVCHFPIGILGQVWYLIVSIPDLCNLTYFVFAPAENAANNIVVVWKMYYIRTIKQEASTTKHMSITGLMRGLPLIGIDAIWRLSLVCLSMRITASFLCYTGYLNFINDPISRVLLQILVHVLLQNCLFNWLLVHCD